MDKIYKLIGNTPILSLDDLREEGEGLILAKLESKNPSGSIKDRPALYMIEEAEKNKSLKPGGTIIEPTSGNTGIALAMIGRSKGYNVILVMPETMSLERQNLMKAYGAELILTEGKLGMQGSVDLAFKLSKEQGYFMPNQFENLNNRRAHYETTGPEILREVENITAFVAGIGTGGTVSGIGESLKERDGKTLVVGVEPEGSPVLSQSKSGAHKIQGIGANFVPGVLKRDILDRIMTIGDEEAYEYSRKLGSLGILVGISSGANIAAAKKLARELGRDSVVVTVLPDTGERYLSTDLFREE